MAKKIRFTYKDEDYTLEFTRRTVRQMEENGFVAKDLENKPVSIVPTLFAGAFRAHHPFIKTQLVNEILDQFPDKYKLVETLAEMYAEPIEAMMADPKEGNLVWTVEN